MIVGQIEHEIEVLEPPAARPDPLDHLVQPARALAAGRALAAALVGEEAAGVVQVIDDPGLVVDHGHGGRSQAQAAGLAQALEVERRVQLVGREHPHADPAGHCGLGLPPLPDAAAVLLDQRTTGDAQGQLDADLAVHVARDRVQLGPVALGRADRFEPGRAAFEDVRDAAERLDVVDDRRLAEGALDGRERRLDPGPAALAFEALDQAGLLAADVGPRAAVNPDVQVEARCRRCSCPGGRRRGPLRSPPRGSGRPGCTRTEGRCRRCSPGWRSTRSGCPRATGGGPSPSSRRLLKVAGSLSSALTHMSVSFRSLGRNVHFRPQGKPAPPRPRSSESLTRLTTASGSMVVRVLRAAW